MIRDNGDWNNWSMIEIEKYPCNDKNEARFRERYWYELLEATMNTQSPTVNLEKRKVTDSVRKKIYYDQNRDKINEKHKVYREQRRDVNKEKHRCECGGCYTTQNKSIHFKTKIHIKYIQENESE